MRGVFAAGVLDVFLESAFDPFELAIGVSAGACNLASHLADQHGRNRRSYMDLMTRREFIDHRRVLHGRSVMDLDWLWDALARREPLDVEAIARRSTEFIVVATSRETGQPVYLRPKPKDMADALKASCALPVLYRGDVALAGERLVDGGVSDPIPAAEAYRRGARRILVVRSRPAASVKTDRFSAWVLAWLLCHEPTLAHAVRASAARYQESVTFLNHPPSDCRIVQIAPPQALATKRTSQDLAALQADYQLGRRLGGLAMQEWGGAAGPG